MRRRVRRTMTASPARGTRTTVVIAISTVTTRVSTGLRGRGCLARQLSGRLARMVDRRLAEALARRSGRGVLSDAGRQAVSDTPPRRGVQACEVEFVAWDVDTSPAPGFDVDPMQLEAQLAAEREPRKTTSVEWVGLRSPDLGPDRLTIPDRPCRFVGDSFDASPGVRGSGSSVLELVNHSGLALQAQTLNVGFDVLELEFQGSFSGPSSDNDGNGANEPTDDEAAPADIASIQEYLEGTGHPGWAEAATL